MKKLIITLFLIASILFICVPKTYAASLQVTSPNGGENIYINQTYEIKWQQSNVSMVAVAYIYKTNVNNITQFNTNLSDTSGSYQWTVPSHLNGDYKIRILAWAKDDNGNNTQITDESDNAFTIKDNKTINITTPTKGQTFKEGESINVTWQYDAGNELYTSTVYLFKGGKEYRQIKSSSGNTPIQVGINRIFPSGNDYQVKVIKNKDSAYPLSALSDYFSITTSWTPEQEIVKVDAGNEPAYIIGKRYTVTWETQCENTPNYVWLVISTDANGQELVIPLNNMDPDDSMLLINPATDLGLKNRSYEWKVPGQSNIVFTSNYGYNPGLFHSYTTYRQSFDSLSGTHSATSQPIFDAIKPGYYKIRVDYRGSYCRATGLSKEIYITDNAQDIPKTPSTNARPTTTPPENNSPRVNTQTPTPTTPTVKVDQNLVNRLKGRIVLQVEDAGKAWYIKPDTGKKVFIKDGPTAYDLMRGSGLGIKSIDLQKIPIGLDSRMSYTDSDQDGLPDKIEGAIGSDPNNPDTDNDGYKDGDEIKNGYSPLNKDKLLYNSSLVNRLNGKIVLQVESHGEAWYINPADGKRYYMADGESAYQVMKYLSLGINNANLAKISE